MLANEVAMHLTAKLVEFMPRTHTETMATQIGDAYQAIYAAVAKACPDSDQRPAKGSNRMA